MNTSRHLVMTGLGTALLGGTLIATTLTGGAQSTPPAAEDGLLRPDVDLIEAQEIAVQEFPGSAVWSIELDRESRGPGLVYEISLGGGEVDLDAMTGDVLRTEWDD